MRRLIAGLLAGLMLVSIALPVRAADYHAPKSQEYLLRGTTVIDVSDALVRRYGEAKAVEKVLENDSRYYNLIHFISAYFMAHKLDSFARGGSFATESFERSADGKTKVHFKGLIGGRNDLVEKMEGKELFRSGTRFLVPFPVDVEGMPEHDWYEFKPDAFEGELVQVPMTIRAEQNVGDSYPDYRRLFEDGVLTISIFYGFDGGDEEFPGGEDLTVAKEFYQAITQAAKRLAFSDPVDEHFGRIKNATTFTRTLEVDMGDGKREVEVRLKLFYRKSPKVKYHFRKELKTADVVIYDGHSSYGGGFQLSSSLYFANPEDTEALDAEMRREHTADKYQIYFMNGCHTYGYYPDMFYDLLTKKDTRNLDVITTINPASFADSVKTDVKMVNLICSLVPGIKRPQHRPRSWAEITGALNAGLTGPTYYGVHGISDNPRTAYGTARTMLAAAPRAGLRLGLELPVLRDLDALADLTPAAAQPAASGFWKSFRGARALYTIPGGK
jgi:hypothetical protein